MVSNDDPQTLVSQASTVIFDSDGVLVEEGIPLPGAKELILDLKEQDKQVIVLSNNSTKHPLDMKENYHAKGLMVNEIINSSMILAEYCNRQQIERVYVVGEPGLVELLAEYGITYTTRNVDAVVVGMDRDLTYEKLAIATRLIRNGALFLATNPDPSFPTPRGLEPGAGAMIAALAASTDRDPDLILGKPQKYGFEMIQRKYQVKAEDCLMVGDRFETDIVGALATKTPALVVNTGIAATRELPGKYQDYPEVPVVQSLFDLTSFQL